MKLIITVSLQLFIATFAFSQYKNDNVLYKTVFPQELCQTLQQNPGYLFFFFFSMGEYADTSSSPGYNLGHLRGATNINVRELGKRIHELDSYKNKPVFVYCSHSQRSRRASKMLVDSGFTKVFNVNGGVTGLRQFPENACLQGLLATAVGYKVIPPTVLCKKMTDGKAVIVDVRSDSAFNRITDNARINAYGSFKNSIHIPLDQLKGKLSDLPKNKEIILVDMYGDEAAKAAVLLNDNGFKKVAVLLEGIDRYLLSEKKTLGCSASAYVSPVNYKTIVSAELKPFLTTSTPFVFLDVREKEEYDNKHTETWRNIGRLRDAVNVPLTTLSTQLSLLEKYKDQTVIVYAFGSSKEVFEAANTLTLNGFKKVHVLMGGLFNVRWTAANVKGNADLLQFVTNVPAENL